MTSPVSWDDCYFDVCGFNFSHLVQICRKVVYRKYSASLAILNHLWVRRNELSKYFPYFYYFNSLLPENSICYCNEKCLLAPSSPIPPPLIIFNLFIVLGASSSVSTCSKHKKINHFLESSKSLRLVLPNVTVLSAFFKELVWKSDKSFQKDSVDGSICKLVQQLAVLIQYCTYLQ